MYIGQRVYLEQMGDGVVVDERIDDYRTEFLMLSVIFADINEIIEVCESDVNFPDLPHINLSVH